MVSLLSDSQEEGMCSEISEDDRNLARMTGGLTLRHDGIIDLNVGEGAHQFTLWYLAAKYPCDGGRKSTIGLTVNLLLQVRVRVRVCAVSSGKERCKRC
jgi:hypothetical protein